MDLNELHGIKIKKDIFFQLVSYNWFVDNRIRFSTSAYILLLFIFRQTIGYQKHVDFLRYNLIKRKTGLSKPTLTKHINWLVTNKYVTRFNSDEDILTTVPFGYRGKIFYGLSENFLGTLINNYENF